MIVELTGVFFIGAASYGVVELLFRGFTHWTMLILGGVCFTLIYLLTTEIDAPVWKKWIAGVWIITILEFFAGILINLKLGWNVWDYSHMKVHLLGQISPLSIFFWLTLCFPAIFLAKCLKKLFNFIPKKKAF